MIETAKKGKDWLKKNNYPFSDYSSLEASKIKFSNGASFGIEMPIINSLKVLETTIHWLEHYNLYCDRFNETRGSFNLTENEIKSMLDLCHEKNIGLVFGLSPRPEYDVKSAFYRSDFGLEQCRKVNNLEAIASALDEAIRLAKLGCRGLVVYDIGILKLLAKMRREGVLPKDMLFKSSSHCMATNPFIAEILHENGADCVTMTHDVSLAVLQETRKLCPQLVMDVPIDSYQSKGGFLRYNELAEIIQISSPVILKIGASAQAHPYDSVNENIIEARVQKVAIVMDNVKRAFGEEHLLRMPKKYCCLPALKTRV